MTKVFCTNTDCVSCEDYNCTKEFISIGDNEEFICQDYQNYRDTAEYQDEFYIAVKTKDGKKAKAVKKGKKIECNGVIFYTTEKDITSESIMVTDKKTGLLCRLDMLQKPAMWEKYLEISKTTPNVQTLPLAEWNEKSREYIIKDEGNDNDESTKNC